MKMENISVLLPKLPFWKENGKEREGFNVKL